MIPDYYTYVIMQLVVNLAMTLALLFFTWSAFRAVSAASAETPSETPMTRLLEHHVPPAYEI